MGCAKRAVGTMLAMTKPMERMLQVLNSSAMAKENKRHVGADGVVALAGQEQERERDGGEQQFDHDVRGEDGLRAQRRGAEALEDAAFAIDGNDGDQRKHRADGDQDGREYRQADVDETAGGRRLAGEARRPAMRPATMKINTGKPMVPKAPSGSRRKTLISIQVSLKSPRIICHFHR